MKLEIQSLNNLECFEFQPKHYSPAKEYQKTTLMMIMNVKQDLRHKYYARAIRRITRLYDFYLDENNDVYSVRRAVINKGKRKRKPFREKPRYKYWVKIPKT